MHSLFVRRSVSSIRLFANIISINETETELGFDINMHVCIHVALEHIEITLQIEWENT